MPEEREPTRKEKKIFNEIVADLEGVGRKLHHLRIQGDDHPSEGFFAYMSHFLLTNIARGYRGTGKDPKSNGEPTIKVVK